MIVKKQILETLAYSATKFPGELAKICSLVWRQNVSHRSIQIRMEYKTWVSFFFFWLVICSPSWGWGTDGHTIIGFMAEDHLKKTTKEAIRDLLDARSIGDPRICTWADQIRSSANYRRKYPNHPTWHYINIDFLQKDKNYPVAKDQNDVLGAIERFRKKANDVSLSKEERKEALMFVIHFVEDLHQPLHCTTRMDDRGGNLQKIKSFAGKEDRLNLHRIWDVDLINYDKKELTNVDFAKRLNEEIKEPEWKEWSKGTIRDWVWESHQLGSKEVYFFKDGKEFPKLDAPLVELTKKNYIDKSLPIMRIQLKRASVRLVKVLNDIYEIPEKKK